MFPFLPEITSLEGVPDKYKPLYSAKEGDAGKYVLDTEVAKKMDVSGLTSALEKERKQHKEAKAAHAKWLALNVGATPEEAAEKLAELNAAATSQDGKIKWEKIQKDLEKGHQAALAGKDTEVRDALTTVERYLLDQQATAAIATAKGSVELLLPHIKSQCKVVKVGNSYEVHVVDKDGDQRGNSTGAFMTVQDLVQEMKASPTFGRAFEASGSTGGGKPPGSSKNGGGAGGDSTKLSPVQKIQLGLNKGLAKAQ